MCVYIDILIYIYRYIEIYRDIIFLILFSIMSHSKRMDTVPRAVQQHDLIVYPLEM